MIIFTECSFIQKQSKMQQTHAYACTCEYMQAHTSTHVAIVAETEKGDSYRTGSILAGLKASRKTRQKQ